MAVEEKRAEIQGGEKKKKKRLYFTFKLMLGGNCMSRWSNNRFLQDIFCTEGN